MKLAHVLTIVVDSHMPVRSMVLSPHMATLLLHLALTSSLLTNTLRMAIVHPPVTPTVLSHSSIVILAMALDKDTCLQVLNHTVHPIHGLHDPRIPSSNRNRNLSLIHNLIRSFNLNLIRSPNLNLNLIRSLSLSLSPNLNNNFSPNLNRSSNIIPRQLKFNRRPNLRCKISLQSSLVRHTCMIRTPPTRIQMFKHGHNTTPRVERNQPELSISFQCPG